MDRHLFLEGDFFHRMWSIAGWAFFALFMALALPTVSFAQEQSPEEKILENFEDETITDVGLLDALHDLRAHPLNINKASVPELLRIPFLSYRQARAIQKYRKNHPPLGSIGEVKKIPGISAELAEALRPYIRFRQPAKNGFLEYRVRTARKLNNIKGFEDGRYHNPFYLYQRMRWQEGEAVDAGTLMEKDAGEKSVTDFSSGYLRLSWKGGHSTFLAGDFNLALGHRLVFSGAYGLPVSTGIFLPFSQTLVRERPHLSVNENAFLRGLSYHFQWRGIEVLLAASRRSLDARLSGDSSAVQSFYDAGLHRTLSESAKQGVVKETLFGGTVLRRFTGLQAGLLAVQADYSRLLNLKNFPAASSFRYYSGFFRGRKGSLSFQGETALLNNKFPAVQQSLLVKNDGFSYGILGYYYHPNYWALHARGFGKISEPPRNEAGFIMSFSARPFRPWRLAGYVYVSRPVREHQKFPFQRKSYQLLSEWKIHRSRIGLRYTRRIRKEGNGVARGRPIHLNELRLQITTDVSRRLRVGERFQLSWRKPDLPGARQVGTNLYIDLRYNAGRRVWLETRWSQFQVPNFDLRLYEFENDLPGSFRNVLLSGRGYKWFVLLRWRLRKLVNLALKYWEQNFPDVTTLGSGEDLIFGNRKRLLRVQLEVGY